jgi:hypothetical protein
MFALALAAAAALVPVQSNSDLVWMDAIKGDGWIPVGASADTALLVRNPLGGVGSLGEPGHPKIWVRSEYAKPNGLRITFEAALHEIDCKAATFRTLSASDYEGRNMTGNAVTTSTVSEWRQIIPGSVYQAVFAFACGG